MTQPWIKFWTRDYLGDSRLTGCSLAAQGLWLRIVCVMSQQNPLGILSDHDGAWDRDHILLAAGVDPTLGAEYLRELESSGAFGRSAEGALMSRRLVREAHDRAAGAERTKRWRAGKHNPRDALVTDDVTPLSRGQKINQSQKPLGKSPSAARTTFKSEAEQRRIVAVRDARDEREQEVRKEIFAGAGPSTCDQIPARPGSNLDVARRKYAEQNRNRAPSRS